MITNPTLTMERERQRPSQSKRAALDPFETLAGALPPLQHDLLEGQSFSLANAKNVTPILYHARDTQLQLYAVPESGMATIGASDALIWAAGHSLAARDYRPPTSRSFGFTSYKLPVATRSGRCQGIEFVVPASFYQGVLDRLLVPRSRAEKRQSGTAHRQGREP